MIVVRIEDDFCQAHATCTVGAPGANNECFSRGNCCMSVMLCRISLRRRNGEANKLTTILIGYDFDHKYRELGWVFLKKNKYYDNRSKYN